MSSPTRGSLAKWSVLAVLAAALAFLAIPPAPLPPRPGTDAWAGQESEVSNAWPHYRKAVDALRAAGLAAPPEARDWTPLSDAQRQDLRKLGPVLEIMDQAGRRPRCQAFPAPPTYGTMPDYRGLDDLAASMVLEARRREEEGDREGAARVLLVAYKMGTEVAEAAAPLASLQVSLDLRRLAAQGIQEWMARGGGGYDLDVEVAQSFGYYGRNMPTPGELLQWETDTAERSLYRAFVQGIPEPGLEPRGWWAPFPGLRVRVYNSAVAWLRRCLAARQEAVSRWDAGALEQVREGLEAALPQGGLGDALARDLNRALLEAQAFPLEGLYQDRARELALQALAAALAWRERHGTLPDRLEPAMAELGLSVPTDPAGGGPLAYRVEEGVPEVRVGALFWRLAPPEQGRKSEETRR